jgi:trk system potassium uptake protein TrkH
MLNRTRPILFLLGILWTSLALMMVIPALADLATGQPDWKGFGVSAGVTLYFGLVLIFANRSGGDGARLDARQAFWFTAASWLSVSLIGSLPFRFGGHLPTMADAVFETVSALTTTGSTVMVGLDSKPAGILLWRALLQWYGGIGIIMVSIALLPLMRVGGMQIFQIASIDQQDKVRPRAAQIAAATLLVYTGLTALSAVALGFAGMTPFDAICHAMSAIATGGFANYDASIGYFHSFAIELVLIVTMLMGSITFVLYLRVLSGEPMALWRDGQFRLMIAISVLASLVIAAYATFHKGIEPLTALRDSVFSVVSIITTTGLVTVDYTTWGPFVLLVIFALTFVGGSSGSTAGGLKMFRLIALYRITRANLHRMIYPRAVEVPHYADRMISPEVANSLLGFVTLWVGTWAALSIGLSATGLDMVTALSGSATALANVGPGMGDIIGPAGNFAPLPLSAKWMLSAGMLLGRLELTTLLVFLHPGIWRA